MRGKLFIKASEKSVITSKGVRAFVMGKILNSTIQKAAVLNIDDKTVEVQLEGEKEKIEAFIKSLKKEVLEKFGNPKLSFTDFQEDLKLEVPRIMRSSQALMVGQLEKGIGIQLEILKALKEMSWGLKELPERLAEKLRN